MVSDRRESENFLEVEKKEVRISSLYLEGRIPHVPLHKEAIVFIHGSGMNYLSGEPIIDTFSSPDFGYRSFTFSLRGHTKSETPRDFAQRGLEMYYEDIRVISEYLSAQYDIGRKERIIWGHSLGGLVAMEEAKANTPQALVLMNSGFPKELLESVGVQNVYPDETEEAHKLLRQEIAAGKIYIKKPEKIRGYFANRLPEDFEKNFENKYAKLLSQESNQVRLELTTNPPEIKPSQIKCPILVVGGTNDLAISIENSRQLADYLKADFLETNLTHLGMFEKDWQEVAGKIDNWLKNLRKK